MRWLGVVLVVGCSFRETSLLDANLPPSDGANDAPMLDTAVDTLVPPVGCPADFEIITGGNAGHRYKKIMTQASWVTQATTTCPSLGAYLSIPNDANELTAIFLASGNLDLWYGVSDRNTEGTFIDVLDQAYAALPLQGNANGLDCVESDDGSKLSLDDCALGKAAVCECKE